MVGTFYSSPAPDAPPFVSVGSVVNHDTTRLRDRGDEGLYRYPRRDTFRDQRDHHGGPGQERPAGRVRAGVVPGQAEPEPDASD